MPLFMNTVIIALLLTSTSGQDSGTSTSGNSGPGRGERILNANRRPSSAGGASRNKPKENKELKKVVRKQFDGLDINGDGTLTVSEIVNPLLGSWNEGIWSHYSEDGKTLTKDKFDKFLKDLHVGGNHDKTFADLDKNFDGHISNDEAKKYAEGVLSQDMEKHFDDNKDGIITWEEFYNHHIGEKGSDEL